MATKIPKVFTLSVNEIQESYFVRTVLNPQRVSEFATLYLDNGLESLPPIEVVKKDNKWILHDGRHRKAALEELGGRLQPMLLSADSIAKPSNLSMPLH
jgi:hypothetical protein